MLQPGTSVLVVIDGTAVELPPLLLAATPRLLKAASLASIPVVFAKYPASPEPGALAGAFGSNLPCEPLSFDPAPITWPKSVLGSRLADDARRQVIVVGIWLEEAVTLLTLNCLSFGYDTYVPFDTTTAAEPALAHAAWLRLTQSGAVPTSSHQVIREWAALHGDGGTQRALLELLATPSSP